MQQLRLTLALLLATGFMCASARQDETPPEVRAVPDVPRPELPGPNRFYTRDYEFHNDWFTHNIPVWQEVMAPYVGRPKLSYLEIGLHEGRSAIWMLEHVLTHETSRLVGIDLFGAPAIEEHWNENVRRAGAEARVRTLKGYSDAMLPHLTSHTFDIIYIDGGHRAQHVLADAILTWKLLPVGGLLIFDDYALRIGFPPDMRPATAIDAFVAAHINELEEVHLGHQVILRRVASPWPEREDVCPVGDFLYLWWDKRVVERNDITKPVEITPAEAAIFEAIILSRPYGRLHFEPSQALRTSAGFTEFCERFNLTF